MTTVACLVTAFASARRLSCQVAEVYDDSFCPVQKKKKNHQFTLFRRHFLAQRLM